MRSSWPLRSIRALRALTGRIPNCSYKISSSEQPGNLKFTLHHILMFHIGIAPGKVEYEIQLYVVYVVGKDKNRNSMPHHMFFYIMQYPASHNT